MDQKIHLRLKKSIFIEEIGILEEILTQLCQTLNFESKFFVHNMEQIYYVDHDSKLLSKIYEIITIDRLKYLINGRFSHIDNSVQNRYPDFVIKSNVHQSNITQSMSKRPTSLVMIRLTV